MRIKSSFSHLNIKSLELGLTEEADSIEINGVTFQKPFVEKPVDAEDHNVYIYYPVSAGGGQTQLFRKVVIKFE